MFRQDWREHINLVIRAFLDKNRKALKALDREERIALIAEIDAAGLFEARNAAPHVAAAMNVSRATVYALLNAARSSSMKAAQSPSSPISTSESSAASGSSPPAGT